MLWRIQDVTDRAYNFNSCLLDMQSFLHRVFFLKRSVERSLPIFGLARADCGSLKVKLVGFVVVFVKEYDGLGGEVVDSHNDCSLNKL